MELEVWVGYRQKDPQTTLSLNLFHFKCNYSEKISMKVLRFLTFQYCPHSPLDKQSTAAERNMRKWISKHGNVSPLLHCLFLYLLLICIDLLPAPQFCWCQKGEGALQYTILFLLSYRGGNEKQMAPLSRTWDRPGGRALKRGVKLKRLQVHIPGQWQPLCFHSCSSQEIRRAWEIRSSIG